MAQCGARARYFGDLDKGWDSFVGAGKVDHTGDASYDAVLGEFCKLTDIARPFDDDDVHHLPNVGNNPSFAYILRDGQWKGEE